MLPYQPLNHFLTMEDLGRNDTQGNWPDIQRRGLEYSRQQSLAILSGDGQTERHLEDRLTVIVRSIHEGITSAVHHPK